MKAILSWSSGKDSAWALHVLRAQGVEVAALLTSVNAAATRVAMHGVREELLDAQAAAAGLPLVKAQLPWPCSNEAYETAMREALGRARSLGATHVAFGDLFLEDIRKYREEKLAKTGVEPLFPLWGRDTAALAREMVSAGLRATIACVDPKQLDRTFAGRIFDEQLISELPPSCDPCGERGEFHTFAWAGPMFARPLRVACGTVVERDGFVYADVLPG
jgi:uncharacterized protein (TIGR00290 family)